MATKTLADIVYSHDKDIEKEEALRLCTDHLQGSWVGLDSSDFDISVFQ